MTATRSAALTLRLQKADIAAAALWLILAMLAGGSTIGGNLQPSRLVTILVFVGMGSVGRFAKPRTLPYQMVVFLGAIWLSWGAASLLWTPDLSMGLSELLIVALGFIIIVTFLNLGRYAPQATSAIRLGWVTANVLTVPLAVWELITNMHLSNAMDSPETSLSISAQFFYAATTFGNRNNYSAFIVLCFPFLLWSMERSRRWILKCVFGALLIFGVFVTLINGTRLGLMAFAVQVAVGVFLRGVRPRHFVRNLVLLLALAATGFVAFQLQPTSLGRLKALEEGFFGSTTDIRTNLSLNGLTLFIRTFGIGVGIGGFEQSVLTQPDMLFTGYIGSAHNLWVEILAQYGAIVFLSFLSWLVFALCVVAKARKWAYKTGQIELERAMRYTIVLMAGFPTGFMMNSSILRWTMLWAVLATVALMTEVGWKKMTMSSPNFGTVDSK